MWEKIGQALFKNMDCFKRETSSGVTWLLLAARNLAWV